MKAVVYKKYGPPDVLEITDIEKPIPRAKEILVKVMASTVTSGDTRLRSSNFPSLFWLPARLLFGLFTPKKKILGHEFAGVIEKTGSNVTKFKVGDAVYGTTTMLRTGSYAEYVCIPEQWKSGVVALKPENLNYQEAAALPIGAMTALYLLEKADFKKGQNLLVYGASGSVGSYAIQIAKQKGLTITGVCSNSNFEMVISLGATNVIDYTLEDYTKGNEKFDIIFDAVGKTSKSKAKQVLDSGGVYVSVTMLTKEKDELLEVLGDMAETKTISPFIDRIFKLDDIRKAHEYVDTGRKRGNVVIDLQN